jgi:hypothetical protein
MSRVVFLAAALAAVASHVSLFAQAQSGSVVGTVSDQGGAVIVGASLTVTNTGTQFSRAATTNAQGQYSVYAFPTGPLSITVEHPGFQKLVRSGIDLTAADILTIDLQLSVGNAQQTIIVKETPPLLQSQTAAVSQLIDNRQMVDLPLNGRMFSTLITLSPGAYTGSAGNLGGTAYALRGNTNFSVNGSQASNNTQLIDGMVNSGLWLNNMVINPTPDAIQEVRAMTSNYQPEYGSSAGMVTVVQTKGGSNEYHGTLYEFLQNKQLNANDFFNNRNRLPRVGARRNEFGGVFGGRIIRDKLFFFADYQGIRQSSPNTVNLIIPTLPQQQMLQTGDFSAFGRNIFDPLNVANGQRVQFPGNRIPSERLDPAVRKLNSLLPSPNITGNPATNFAMQNFTTQRTDQYDVRIDQNIGSDRLFAKYSYDWTHFELPGQLPTPANPGIPIGPYLGTVGRFQRTKNWVAAVNHTKLFGPLIVNEIRIGAVRWSHEITPLNTEHKTAEALGIPGINVNPFAGGLPGYQVQGQNWVMGDNSTFPEQNREVTYQLEDILTRIRGTHTFKFGARFLRHHLNGYSSYPTRGLYTFSGAYTSQLGTASTAPNGLADWALGASNSVTRNILDGTFGMRFWNLSGFAQDTWRVNNRLTIDAGLRYEIQAPANEVADRWSNFDVTTGRLLAAGQGGNSRRLRNLDTNNLAPRLGLAYVATKDGKTVIRSGFGISYLESYNVGQQLYRNAPNFLSQAIAPATNQAPTLFVRNGLPVPIRPAVVNGVVQVQPGTLPYAWDFNMLTPKSMQWSFGIQRQLTSDLAFEAAYIGTRGLQMISNVNYNQALPGTGSVNSRRPLATIQPNVQQVQFWTNRGDTKYHSLQLKLTKHLARGLSGGFAYTWSKNLASSQGPSQSGDPIQDARCFACEWGNALEDRRHVAVFNHVYELPFGPGRSFLSKGVLSRIAGNWNLSGVWTFRSGNYFNVLMSSAVSNTGPNVAGGTYDRPNRIADGNFPKGEQSIDRWFNNTAFAAPTAGTFGNSARNPLYGPGFINTDLGLHRHFIITERWRAMLRWETFNTFNKANFGLPNANFGSTTFGRITTTTGPRVMQLALKLTF